MRCKKHIQQIGIADPIWIEPDPQTFRMAGVPTADQLIGRVRHMAANIAAFHPRHAIKPSATATRNVYTPRPVLPDSWLGSALAGLRRTALRRFGLIAARART